MADNKSLIDQLFGGWNNFAGNAGNTVNNVLRTHPLVGGAMDGLEGLRKGLGQVTYSNDGPSGGGLGRLGIREGDWGNKNPALNIPISHESEVDRMPGLAGNGRETSDYGLPVMSKNDREMDLQMSELKSALDRQFQPTGEYNSMIEQAYAGALSNIGKAKGDANANFEKSDAAINDMTQGHVHEIKTNDRAAIGQNANQLTDEYSQIYGDGRKQLQADQANEMKIKAEAVSRLGLQESGMGEAGQTQQDAITRMTQDETGAKAQASSYKAADLTRNTELAASQAGQGVERRSALHNQLQKILGSIGDSEASVNQSIGLAKLQGAQAEKSDFRQEQQFNLDSLNQLQDQNQKKSDSDRNYALELQKLQAKQDGSASGDLQDNVGEAIRSRGIDPQPYLDAYNEVLQQGYNQNVNGDKNSFFSSRMKESMRKKGLNADDSVIGRVVLGINQSGTNGYAK